MPRLRVTCVRGIDTDARIASTARSRHHQGKGGEASSRRCSTPNTVAHEQSTPADSNVVAATTTHAAFIFTRAATSIAFLTVMMPPMDVGAAHVDAGQRCTRCSLTKSAVSLRGKCPREEKPIAGGLCGMYTRRPGVCRTLVLSQCSFVSHGQPSKPSSQWRASPSSNHGAATSLTRDGRGPKADIHHTHTNASMSAAQEKRKRASP
jgi:hypothetical protein